MTRGYVPCPVPKRNPGALSSIDSLCRPSGKAGIIGLGVAVLILWLAATGLPLMADGTNAVPAQPAAAGTEDFGQYLADHQGDIAPFFMKNAGDLFRLAV